jgi:hypothetical protein
MRTRMGVVWQFAPLGQSLRAQYYYPTPREYDGHRLRWLVGRAVSPLNRPAPGASIPCLSWPVEISWPTVTLMAHRNLMAHLISCSNQNSFP